jgi:hypothetical protein
MSFRSFSALESLKWGPWSGNNFSDLFPSFGAYHEFINGSAISGREIVVRTFYSNLPVAKKNFFVLV